MAYDLFISYSRRDNRTGRVTELKEQIAGDYLARTGEELHCFFDVTEINTMDDWRNRILGGLREAKLLLLVLTPAYLDSPYCEWEIVEFLKYEHSKAVQGQGVAQVYFVEIPGLDTPGFEERFAAWVVRVRKRNHVDLRPWHDEGASALAQLDVRERLDDLERSLVNRISRLRRIANAPGNLPAHNPRFVGREVEMERLHKAAGLGQFGVLTAVQGLGGMGKTALAIQYAYAFADFYPGGRWVVSCAGVKSLAAAVRSLDSDLGVQLTEEEQKDDTRAAKRVLTVLQRKAEEGAAARAGETHPPEAKALVILDNVDVPDFLQPPQTGLLTGRRWLHVIGTTRLDPGDFGFDSQRHTHLAVDELPEEDAVRLIESYQPQGRFANEAERTAARGIARLLGGFPLAVEVAAVYLGERKGRLTCEALLERLRSEGVDEVALRTRGGVSHAEKLVSATLAPTLECLTEEEGLVLTVAALLPPDSVAVPWLRAVAVQAYPALADDVGTGCDDPWLDIVNHLVGLRLLQATEWTADGLTPLVCRVHRLIHEAVKQRNKVEVADQEGRLLAVAEERARFLYDGEGWIDWNNRWEIHPLTALAYKTLDENRRKAADLAHRAALCQSCLGDYAAAQPLFERALEARERALGPEHPETLCSLNDLAGLLARKGDYSRAKLLYERALEASERVLGPEHPDTLSSVNNLAFLLDCKGDYSGAKPLYERALDARERVQGPEHPQTLVSANNLAGLLASQGDYVGARPLYERALEASERVLGPDHPQTLASVNALAVLLYRQEDYGAAKVLYERALEASERVLGPDHPDTLLSVNNLAVLLSSQGDYVGAKPLYESALEASERVLGPNHPSTLLRVNNLAALLFAKGDYTGARILFERALASQTLILGPEHPDTLTTKGNLAVVREKMKRLEELLEGVPRASSDPN